MGETQYCFINRQEGGRERVRKEGEKEGREGRRKEREGRGESVGEREEGRKVSTRIKDGYFLIEKEIELLNSYFVPPFQ